jgi:antitoxin PrlF
MKKKDKAAACASVSSSGYYNIEALISIDERGQMVLPKELREKANIKAGEKLALVTKEKDGEICCILLIKTKYLSSQVDSLVQ